MHTSPSDNPIDPAETEGPIVLAPPRVCVIVTCFNYAKFVAEALNSVAAQTFRNWECIVVDDGSTDNSVAVIERWIAHAQDGRFRLIRCETNRGQLAAIGRGLHASDSEFVAMLDADDFWFSEFLRRHIDAHLNHLVSASVSCSEVVQVDGEARLLSGNFAAQRMWTNLGEAPSAPVAEEEIPRLDAAGSRWKFPKRTGVTYIKSDIFRWHWTASSAMVFRRTMLELAFPNDAGDARIGSDPYFVQICHYFTGSIILDETLSAYRRHGRNTFSSLPNFGVAAFGETHASRALGEVAVAMELRHVLDRYDDFVSIFGTTVPLKFVRTLFNQQLGQGRPVDDRRIRTILGTSRYYRDRLRSMLRRLRRRH